MCCLSGSLAMMVVLIHDSENQDLGMSKILDRHSHHIRTRTVRINQWANEGQNLDPFLSFRIIF